MASKMAACNKFKSIYQSMESKCVIKMHIDGYSCFASDASSDNLRTLYDRN